jgi:hypothetical protein
MSLVVDALEEAVMDALPGADIENTEFLRALAQRLILNVDDLDPAETPSDPLPGV